MTSISTPTPAASVGRAFSPKPPGGDGSSRDLPKGWLGFPIRAWVMAGMIALVFAVLYSSSLRRLWLKTNPIDGVAEWAHAVFVPLIGLYYLYINLDDLLKAKVKPQLGADFNAGRFISAAAVFVSGLICWKLLPTLPGPFAAYAGEVGLLGQGMVYFSLFVAVLDWGLGTLFAGLIIFAYGIWPGSNDFIKDIGMVMTVFGAVLTICGWQVMRIAWFPCVFLICALPWPGLFYSKVAMPMQQLSAVVAVAVMQVFGVDVENAGTQIIIHKGLADPRVLNVAEACAGIKSLMTFVTMGAAVAFLWDTARPMWQKVFITASAVPIAIACNAARVSGQGLLDFYASEQWSSGFAHQFAGLVFLLPGFVMLLALVWLLDKLFVEEDDSAIGTSAVEGGVA